jgi:purine-binding chemotaxis protein CheW
VRGKFVILLNVDHVLSLDDLGTLADAADRTLNALAV